MFLNDWSKPDYNDDRVGLDAMIHDFEITIDTLEGITILLASYTYKKYEGDAFVLIAKDGKLYEVNGSHCSCYGLEGQWEPEETTKEALMHRLENGKLGMEYDEDVFASELRKVLSVL